MSNDIPLAFQVAVLGAEDRPIGSGLVLDSLRVLTCTHVVAQATADDPKGVPRSDKDVKLRAIPWPGGDPLIARLHDDAWRMKSATLGDRGVRDLAVLEFAKQMDGWPGHCAIYPGSCFPQNEASLFGFTRDLPDGVRTGVFVKGEVAGGWFAIDAAPNAQYRVQGGFSGGPLFDPETKTALGLVAEADTGEGRTGFLIPGRAILEFLQSLPDPGDLAEKVRARAFVRNAPELPRKLTRRTSLVELIIAMLGSDSTTVGLVGLRGMGGIGKLNRPGLTAAIAACAPGDVLTVWKLDRLGRSMAELVGIVDDLWRRGVGLKVLTGEGAAIDTTRPEGRFILGVFATFAEFERELIRERTREGMKAARRRGKRLGRQPLLGPEKLDMARRLIAENKGRGVVARMLGVDPSTLRRGLNGKGRDD